MSVIIRDAVPADAAGIAWVHVESWRTTYPGIVPQVHLDALSVAERTEMWQAVFAAPAPSDCTLVAVADDGTGGGEIVGFVHGKSRADDPDFQAEIETLYLLQSQQGRGLGRRLLTAAAKQLCALGFPTLFLWTHVRNPARGFYEALGGRVVRTGQRTVHGVTYDDAGYGWDEAALLNLIERT